MERPLIFKLTASPGFVNLSTTVGPDWCDDKHHLGSVSEEFADHMTEDTPLEQIYQEIARVAARPENEGVPWTQQLTRIRSVLGLPPRRYFVATFRFEMDEEEGDTPQDAAEFAVECLKSAYDAKLLPMVEHFEGSTKLSTTIFHI